MSEFRDLLNWPFDSSLIMRKKKSIKRELESEDRKWTEVRIAILGGSTTNDIQDYMELFLLAEGIRPSFYASEYGKYWEDGMFGNQDLDEFKPQIVFIHTTSRNIKVWPDGEMADAEVDALLDDEFENYKALWQAIQDRFGCTIIQNNFDRPYYRLLGNQDICIKSGNSYFIHCLNSKFYEYAQENKTFFIHDIDYLAQDYGLNKWHDGQAWDLYKSAFTLQAGPAFAYNLSRIIKAIYGKNKKALALDLDNTMWGGIVGEDGPENLEMGSETAKGEGYRAFQEYLSKVKKLGILLTINSKNDEANAIAGLEHPDSVLKPDDFVLIKANWMSKDHNIRELADEIDIGIDSFVFVDDNPAEREMVHGQYPEVIAPKFEGPEDCIHVLDSSGFFEVAGLTDDDKKRSEMYKANVSRKQQEKKFGNYDDYLLSLEMRATIKDFEPVYISRIAQLTNKTNQFNLTTKRYSESEIEAIAQDAEYIRLYGRLEDKFGDNGLISVVFGKITDNVLNIDEWLMSCRVLKRDVENAMFDALVEECAARGIDVIRGYYYPTPKNHMVEFFYQEMGFEKIAEDTDGNTTWQYNVKDHVSKNKVIREVVRE